MAEIEHGWKDDGRGHFGCDCGTWSVRASDLSTDDERASKAGYRMWEAHVKEAKRYGFPFVARSPEERRILQAQARASIDMRLPYYVQPDPEYRMKHVAELAQILSVKKAEHQRRPWQTSAGELAIWQEHYDRAVRAYTDPFDTKEHHHG